MLAGRLRNVHVWPVGEVAQLAAELDDAATNRLPVQIIGPIVPPMPVDTSESISSQLLSAALPLVSLNIGSLRRPVSPAMVVFHVVPLHCNRQ